VSMRKDSGFTIIELLVVLAAMGLLLALAAPRYVDHVDRSREAVLKHNLKAAREAIERYNADRGRYPASLQELVTSRYLREVPLDPITERTDSWLVVGPNGAAASGAVFDLKSGASGQARDGTAYATW
jgi:general secretion pathway protein G